MASEKENALKENGKLEKWREAMSSMSLKELLKIKFCYSKYEKWQLMYSPYDETKKKWFCMVCRNVLVDGNAVLLHNGYNKHKNSLETKVFDLFHETLGPFKSEKVVEPKSTATLGSSVVMDFKNKLFTLTLEEILEVQYKISDLWKNLIIPLQKGYNCTICKSNLLTSIQGIRNHMSNRQHKSNMDLILELHHPTYSPLKGSDILVNKKKQLEEVSKQNVKEIVIEKTSAQKPIQNLNAQTTGSLKATTTNIEKKTQHAQNVKNRESVKKTQNEQNVKIEQSTVLNENIEPSELETISQAKDDQPLTQLTKKTITEFLSEMSSMRKEDVVKVEYKGNDRKWKNIIVSDGDSHYSCQICNVRHLKDIPLNDHIKGKKHKDKALISVVRFFHPVFTEPKDLIQKSHNPIKENKPVGKTLPKKKAPNDNLIKITPVQSVEQEKNLLNNTDIETVFNKEPEIVIVEESPEKELIPPGTESTPKKVVNPVAFSIGNKTTENFSNNKNKTKLTNKSKQNSESIVITESNVENKIRSHFQKKGIQAKNNVDDIEGFVGIEYVIKIIKHATDSDPRFECCLCETELNGTGMQYHLKGLMHRTKYLERHFGTCIKQFKEYRANPTVMYQIAEKICKAVEKYHGRDLPLECVQNDYRSNRRDYLEKVFSFRHASEMSGPSFTNIVSKNDLQNIINNKDFKIPDKSDGKITFIMRDNQRITNYPFTTESDNGTFQKESNIPVTRPTLNPTQIIPTHSNVRQQHHQVNYNPMFDSMVPSNIMSFQPISQDYSNVYNPVFYEMQSTPQNTQYQAVSDQSMDVEEHRRLAEKFIKNTKMNDKPERYKQTPYSPRRHRKSRSRSKSRSWSRREMRSLSKSPLREGDIWQAYRRKFDMDVKIIDMDFKQYHKDPQSHPLYNEEWQSFWANRMNHLKQAGRDYHNHDFTYEWSIYFPKRLEELYDKEIEALKVRIRERYVLPMHNHELRDSRYHVQDTLEPELIVPEPPEAPSIKKVSNREISPPSHKKSRTDMQPKNSSSSYASKRKSSEEILNEYEIKEEVEEISTKKRKKVGSRSSSPTAAHDDIEKELEKDSLTAMSVIRVLTALEDNLGTSLGPKIIDLMSKALVLEKTKPNAVDENLLTIGNCILLETCREKLKGQIVAGIYKNQQLRAVKTVIKNITNLVEKASAYRIKHPEKLPEIQAMLKNATATLVPPKFSSAPRPPAKAVLSKSSPSVSNPKASNQSSFNFGSDGNMASSSSSSVASATPKQSNIPSMSMLQKKELAKKLAQALSAQGKTDVSTENCEQLIDIYTLIDKKQRESGTLNSQEKSLSECLQDCLKSGSLASLTSLIQDKNKASSTETSQQSQLNQMTSKVQSILMAINNQTRFSQLQQRNDYTNFAHLANFDTSLNFNPTLPPNRSSFRGPIGGSMSNKDPFNNTNAQNWIQGSVLSGSNYNAQSNSSTTIPQNMSSYMSGQNMFNASNNSNSNQLFRNMPHNNLNSNSSFNRNNIPSGGNWQRSDYDSSSSQQPNNFQDQYSSPPLNRLYNRR